MGAISDMELSSVHDSMLEDSDYIGEERKVAKLLPVDKNEFACLNNNNLQRFEYGERMDNALTYMIRNNRFDLFKYLLK
jgi:hypothetical protein